MQNKGIDTLEKATDKAVSKLKGVSYTDPKQKEILDEFNSEIEKASDEASVRSKQQ